MDFIPIIKEVPVTLSVAVDTSDYNEKGISGVMFYAACTVTLSDGTNTIDIELTAYQPLRLPANCTSITSDTTTTMIRGQFDQPEYT